MSPLPGRYDPYDPRNGRLPTMLSAGADFIRRQTIPKRGATTRRVKLTREGNFVNESVSVR